MASRVSITDVARSAMVSPATASLVLNGKARELRIKADTAERVRKAAGELGYRPSFHSRAVRLDTARTVGFLTRSDIAEGLISSGIFAEFLGGMHQSALERGLLLVMARAPSPGAKSRRPPVVLTEDCLDGAVVFYSLDESARKSYAEQSLPTVWLDADVRESTNCVFRDEAEAFALATEYLLELGHTRIAYFHPEYAQDATQHVSNPLGLQGYLDAMRRAGQKPMVVPYDSSIPDHVSVVRKALESRPRPTGFVGQRGIHAYHALLKLGLKVPEQASVVSCGYRSDLHYIMPGMTEVTFDRHRLGYEAAEMLCRLIPREWDRRSCRRKEESS